MRCLSNKMPLGSLSACSVYLPLCFWSRLTNCQLSESSVLVSGVTQMIRLSILNSRVQEHLLSLFSLGYIWRNQQRCYRKENRFTQSPRVRDISHGDVMNLSDLVTLFIAILCKFVQFFSVMLITSPLRLNKIEYVHLFCC